MLTLIFWTKFKHISMGPPAPSHFIHITTMKLEEIIEKYCFYLSLDKESYIKACDYIKKNKRNNAKRFAYSKSIGSEYIYRCAETRESFILPFKLCDHKCHIYNYHYFESEARWSTIITYKHIYKNVRVFSRYGKRTYFINNMNGVSYVPNRDIMKIYDTTLEVNFNVLDEL